MAKKPVFLMILLTGTALWAPRLWAGPAIVFGPQDTQIEGSIKYTVLGRYTAHFNRFQGKILLDDEGRRVKSVYLSIDAASLQSSHPRFDKLAKSRRLLNTARYPKIIFKSDRIVQTPKGYQVQGVLAMHGITRALTFPFEVKVSQDARFNRSWIELHGRWDINRKDFNIIWNRVLDHGGVLVSDHFWVDWGIKGRVHP